MIQKSILLSVLSICIAGCTTNNPTVSTFEDLRWQVKHTLGPDYECSPTMSYKEPHTDNAVTNWYFEVNSPHSLLTVKVTMRKFVAQNEWGNRYKDGTNAWANLLKIASGSNSSMSYTTLTNQPHFLEQFTNFVGFFELPGWHYKNIGVDVDCSEPDVAYPGLDENTKAARDVMKKVESYLEPYQ